MLTLLSFYRHIQFNVPRTITATGMLLLIGGAAVHVALLLAGRTSLPVWADAYGAALVAAAVIAAVAIAATPWRAVTRVGWVLGSCVSIASIVVYLLAHTAGLSGLSRLAGRWDYPLATFALILAATFLAVHASIVTRMNVAVPDRRNWYD